MTDWFPTALQAVLDWEGGYSDDPDDPGGETRYGISKNAHPDEDIANLTKERAEAIYRRDYWDKCHCGDMPGWLAIAVFDCAVNQGPSRATHWLQEALRVRVDGIIGPITLEAAQSPPAGTLTRFMAERAMHYAQLNRKYHRGWYRRLIDIHQTCVQAAFHGGI